MIKLQKTKSYIYNGIFSYLITYDHSSGRKNRYTVMIENYGNPFIIGRELELSFIKEIIANYESKAKLLPNFCGERKDIAKVHKMVINERK